MIKAQTPKGFRDFLPEDSLKRKFVLDKIISVYEKFGFDPLETPTLEYSETLKGKYGEEEKLIYQFKTHGGDEVALRYDQTVPLARVIAQYGPTGLQKIVLPFKRYQIQSAFRGENTQKGRYREFTQCDVDTIGVSTPLSDAELLAIAYEIYQALDLQIIIKINDRSLITDIEPKYLAAIDKLKKIGAEGVLEELQNKGLSKQQADQTLNKVKQLTPSENLNEIIKTFTQMGYSKDILEFDPTLIRGLDYYTGLILEVVLESEPNGSSLSGGGRYDQLIGKFTGNDLAATGFSIGLDRTIEAMDQAGVLTQAKTATKVLVGYSASENLNKALELTTELRKQNISTEVWLLSDSKFEKQFKYAEKKGIGFIALPEDSDKIKLKDLKTGEQNTLTLEQVIDKLK